MTNNIHNLDADIQDVSKEIHRKELDRSKLVVFKAWLGIYEGASKETMMKDNDSIFHGEYTELINKYIPNG